MDEAAEQDRAKLPPPHTVKIQFGLQWGIITPSAYRYEDQKWIDEFFNTGRLRLSTFAKFATYPDEARGDGSEGKAVCFGETSDNNTIVVAQSRGLNAAVLCCSQRLDHALRESFKRSSAFLITNTVGFGHEIARQLPGFRHGLASFIHEAA